LLQKGLLRLSHFPLSTLGVAMNKFHLLAILCLGLVLSSCKKDSDPVSANQSAIDWEGNYPLINTAYSDSIIFDSNRYLGTNYAPCLYIAHKSGSGVRPLMNTGFTMFAGWSPRRWQIVFLSQSGWGASTLGIFTMNINGTNLKRISPVGEDVSGRAAWSPDGNTIAYVEIDSTDQYGRGRIKLVDPDGGNPRVLTGWFSQLHRMTWSPDSKRIAFGGNDKIYIINANGTGVSPLFEYSQSCYAPSWSPDGTLIAFNSFAYSYESYFSKVFTYNVQTHKIIQITTGSTEDWDPTWSPDSKMLVYGSSPPGLNVSTSIYRINIDGSNNVRLTDASGSDWNVSWYQ
jgi:Tol biopolymer transport system component